MGEENERKRKERWGRKEERKREGRRTKRMHTNVNLRSNCTVHITRVHKNGQLELELVTT